MSLTHTATYGNEIMKKELFEKFMVKRLSPEERRELLNELSGNEEERSAFVDFALEWTATATVAHKVYEVRKQEQLLAAPRKPSASRRFWIPLAAAATVLIVAGVYLLHDQGAVDPMPQGLVRVEKQIGDVSVNEDVWETASSSYCRLAYPDETRLMLDEESRAALSTDPATKGKLIEHENGRIYLAATRQARTLTVNSGNMIINIQGTELLFDRKAQPYTYLLSGRASIRGGESSTWLNPGQMARLEPSFEGPRLVVITEPVARENISWLNRLDVDIGALRKEAGTSDTLGLVNGVNYDSFRIVSGSWLIRQTNTGIGVDQNSLKIAAIIFGPRNWLEGEVSYEYRVLSKKSSKSTSGVTFDYEEGRDFFGLYSSGNQFAAKGEWVHVVMKFKLDKKANAMRVNKILVSNVARPEVNGTFSLTQGPWNSKKKTRGPCAIGLETRGCTVKFRNIVFKAANAK